MDSFGAVRHLARAWHAKAKAKSGGASTADALLSAARELTGLKVTRPSRSNPLLGGGDGALHRKSSTIAICKELAGPEAAFVEAHEFGHFCIETPDAEAVAPTDVDPGAPEEATPLGVRRVEAYSSQELRERHANVFAREFLLPREEARRLFLFEHLAASEIAVLVGAPLSLVHQQLAASLLLPDIPVPKPSESADEKPGLDPSQRAAAEHAGSPLLVEAGPGTGKTRTLVARVEHLLENGVPAIGILALTFSNKAAREIRERVAAANTRAAAEIWAGTFHAFGLELLRKYGERIGVPSPVRVMDQADALELLERELPTLGLDHYLRLHEPLSELRYILTAISRAKDELKTPSDYAQAARAMKAAATSQDERVVADKALEAARVYARYDEVMRVQGWVDFADLINRPIELLRAHPDVLEEVSAQYQHVLVDEYQDVNRASAILLKLIVGDGRRLWAVGDARQSIYRFRGAAPVNTIKFTSDYSSGVRKALKVNYRSREQIVQTFGHYATTMIVGGGAPLDADLGPGPDAIDYNEAATRDAEIAGVAAAVRRHHAAGIPYAGQAVLCRSHSNLQHMAEGLERLGVPVLYLGDLFERPEVRDLLSLLSMVAEPHRGGLLRLATLAPYAATLDDVRAVLAFADQAAITPQKALGRLAEIERLTIAGRNGLTRLADDLSGVEYRTGPGAALCKVLFDRGQLLRPWLEGETASDQQRRLAVHQFLQFAIENDRGPQDPKRHLLDWVRRLEVFGDERALREPPTAVEGIDAVRLMTVHASKGLEFPVVHLPVLGKGIFPLRWTGQRCPLPAGLLSTDPVADQAEEEQCLFFVALSRARDHLSLSRAERYSEKQGSNASSALEAVRAHLPRAIGSGPHWTGSTGADAAAAPRTDVASDLEENDGHAVDLYLTCPRKYLYQIVLGLSGGREDSGYVQFHRAVYAVLQAWGEAPPTSEAALAAALDDVWQTSGPKDHPLEPLYRDHALRILGQAAGRPLTGVRVRQTVTAVLAGRRVTLEVDELQVEGNGFVLRRLRTGRPPSKPDQRALHALMLEATRQTLGLEGRFEVHYLTNGEPVEIDFRRVMSDRLAQLSNALKAMAAGRYPAEIGDHCARCPHYFICPGLPPAA